MALRQAATPHQTHCQAHTVTPLHRSHQQSTHQSQSQSQAPTLPTDLPAQHCLGFPRPQQSQQVPSQQRTQALIIHQGHPHMDTG